MILTIIIVTATILVNGIVIFASWIDSQDFDEDKNK